MEYNTCKICGANGGRAGMLINSPSNGIPDACMNCYDTLTKKEVSIHMNLRRTEEELNITINLLNARTEESVY